MEKYYFTSESVTEGHPDKICDKIADKILDSALEVDPNSKMAVEATIKDNLVFIYGECNTLANLNFKEIANEVLKDIGYNEDFEILEKVSKQSNEINKAVTKDKISAGDQGIMFGYATNETKEFMPLPIILANKLAKKLSEVRRSKEIDWLLPDGKTQVTIEYIDNIPKRVDTIIIACQHTSEATDIEKEITEKVIKKVVPVELLKDTKILINTSGSFIIGGPYADSGTTGRKIIVDTYGGMGRIGGGCLSSKSIQS